jgi:hypothetical protein
MSLAAASASRQPASTPVRHHAVADEFVDAPACRLHRVPHLAKVPIQQEHQVVRGASAGLDTIDLASLRRLGWGM